MTDTDLKFARCNEMVSRGVSMVRGLRRASPCENKVVFVAADGKTYCARHGKDHGYVAPEKPAKRSWLVFFVDRNGTKTFRYMYDLVSERGVRMSWGRTFSEKIEGIVPYSGDADFRASEDFKKWGAWFS